MPALELRGKFFQITANVVNTRCNPQYFLILFSEVGKNVFVKDYRYTIF